MMTPKTNGRTGTLVLMLAHCAGMVDLMALPIWMGVLIGHYRFDPQRAGGLVTLFLVGAVLASLVCATRFARLAGRWKPAAGFGLASAAFALLAHTDAYAEMAILHALAGVATGVALSITHGTIGRSANPHRLFAIVGAALGVFALVFFATVPPFLAGRSGATLFNIIAAVMAVAAVAALLRFPPPASHEEPAHAPRGKPPAIVWFGILGIGLMAVVQAMVFGFVERIGIDRGFGQSNVHGLLVVLGVINLLPALLAALLERRLPARGVLLAGPLLQAVIGFTISTSETFMPYAVATSLLVGVMIFTHTFAFGLLARLDTSGRAVAATPAMIMTGAAIGPILGGTLVKGWGYPALGLAAVLVAALAFFCFLQMRQAHAEPRGAAKPST